MGMLDHFVQNFTSQVGFWDVTKVLLSLSAVLWGVFSGVKLLTSLKSHSRYIKINSQGKEVIVSKNLSSEDIKKILDTLQIK